MTDEDDFVSAGLTLEQACPEWHHAYEEADYFLPEDQRARIVFLWVCAPSDIATRSIAERYGNPSRVEHRLAHECNAMTVFSWLTAGHAWDDGPSHGINANGVWVPTDRCFQPDETCSGMCNYFVGTWLRSGGETWRCGLCHRSYGPYTAKCLHCECFRPPLISRPYQRGRRPRLLSPAEAKEWKRLLRIRQQTRQYHEDRHAEVAL